MRTLINSAGRVHNISILGINLVRAGFLFLLVTSCTHEGDAPHPIVEFLFGFEEEGYVFYPVSHRDYFFAIVGLVFLLLIGLFWVLYLNTKTRSKLVLQKEALQLANQKVLSSLNYARRIQDSLLPTNETTRRFLKDFSVFYQPRDIVSGDFYWFAFTPTGPLVIAMDCTGHGVPGSFLTLLTYQELRKIIYEREIVDPAEILFALHNEFNQILNKGNQSFSDGVEIGICRVRYDDSIMDFAGANLPLLFARNGKVERIKSSRLWIGSPLVPTNGNPFTSIQIEIQEGDFFFLASDGIQDQFGGDHNKKMLNQKLLAMLEKNLHLQLQAQMEAIRSSFFSWKGSNPQTDDVLILGFQVK